MKNLKITKKICSLALASMLCGALTGCGDDAVLETQKSFNFAIDESNGAVSIVSVSEYSDFDGEQVQIETIDGLKILTSSKDTKLINQHSKIKIEEYATCIANGNEENIIFYDELQGNEIDWEDKTSNKKIYNTNNDFEKAIIENEDGITIVDIESWLDYEDGKIQLTLTDGTIILENASDIKLINMSSTSEDSLYNYAYSLVGDDSKIYYYSTDYGKTLDLK